MKKRSYILFLLLGAALTGCIRDNSDCVVRYEVELHFCNRDVSRAGDDFLDLVGSVRVGIFDDAGNFLLEQAVNENDLRRFQGIRLHLSEGDYTAVCWGNATGINSHIDFSKNLNAAEEAVYHPDHKTGRPISTNDPLYYGRLDFTVLPTAASNTVYFKPAHVKLRIEVRGLQHINPPLANIHDLSVRVTDLHPAYTQDMTACGAISTYHPRVTVNAAVPEAIAWCDILRFDGDNNPITIQVAPDAAAAPIHTEPLADFMTAHGLTITDGHELVIPLIITFQPAGGVTVTIGPWVGQPTFPGGM